MMMRTDEASPTPPSPCYSVLAVYVAVALWGFLAFRDFTREKSRTTLIYGTLLAVALNVRYLVNGHRRGVAFFVALYDVTANLFLNATNRTDEAVSTEIPQAMAPCNEQEACSTWPSEYYAIHPKWSVAFYQRFVSPAWQRSALFTGHIVVSTIVFVLMHYQIFFSPPTSASGKLQHRILGYTLLAFLILGVGCALHLASEHGPVREYGGNWSKY